MKTDVSKQNIKNLKEIISNLENQGFDVEVSGKIMFYSKPKIRQENDNLSKLLEGVL